MKPVVNIKNWSFCNNNRLQGNVYGHPKFADGDTVLTSRVQKITDCGTYKIVETNNTNYKIMPDDVDKRYEELYPNAYERAKIVVEG
ncbi:MAG: hypothetical protein ACK5MV_13730 [Aminipila sp.]